MKKIIFYAGMVILIILGILIDNLRVIPTVNSGSLSDILPAAWFDILASLVYITFIGALAYLVFQFRAPLFVAIIYVIVGLLLASIFVIELGGISLPPMIDAVRGPVGTYTRLSGAFWLMVGIFNIVKFFRLRAARAGETGSEKETE